MPYLLNIIKQTPEDAIEQAIEDTVKKAKDVWGLNYAESSNGLYPAGSEIGRTQFRPSHCSKGAQPYPEGAGGEWRTVYYDPSTGGIYGMGTDANGWGTWLDFNVSEDNFIVIEGVFSKDADPSITEFVMNLSGTKLPVVQVESGLYATEERTLRGYFEVPAIVSPKAEIIFSLRSSHTNVTAGLENEGKGLSEKFGFIGDTIAKRSYLIKQVY